MVQDSSSKISSAHDPEYTAFMSAGMLSVMLDLLVCPVCKRHGLKAIQNQDRLQWLVCSHCNLGYPVVDGIPVMLSSRATPQSNAL